MGIEISLKQNLEKSASAYFEKAKKAKLKLEGAEEALIKSKQKVEQLIKQKPAIKEVKQARKKQWYEKFRWFYSSTGNLVLLGRDATTNEILIKKHTDKQDMVFHIDVMKGPFCVVKGIDKVTLKEAADATGSFSEAWKRGLAEVEVFSVNANQVSKEAQSGEYMSKGMFMIYGKKQLFRAKVELALGLAKDGAVMCGPVAAIKANCKKHVPIFQGNGKASALAKTILHLLGGGDLDEIIRVLPSGGSTLR